MLGLQVQVCLEWLYKTRVLSVFGVRLVLLIMGTAASRLGRRPRSDVLGGPGGGIPVLGVLSHQQSLPPQSLLLVSLESLHESGLQLGEGVFP